jgi:hypothetical protein
MYSRSDFARRFADLDTPELVDKLASQALTDEAQAAIIGILDARGLSGEALDREIRSQRSDYYRRTGVTNTCDHCGKSTFPNGFVDRGQRFCSEACLQTLRSLEATANMPAHEILDHALRIRSGACPKCGRRNGINEARRQYWVWSALVFASWGHDCRIQCRRCAVRGNLECIAACLLLGPWSIKGIVLTPVQIVRNIGEMMKADAESPSEECLWLTRLQLGRERIEAGAQGAGTDRVP